MAGVRTMDLNADIGEGCSDDLALMRIVTSVNVACGGHAGDERTMRETVRAAITAGVAIGAHPSFPDRDGFGRRVLPRTPEEICHDVREQTARLQAIARDEGAELTHVKPHGALYNLAARDRAVAEAIARAVRDLDARLALVGLMGGAQIAAARRFGLRAIREAFADRAYRADGTLVPREHPGAVLDDPRLAAAQAVRITERGDAETICVHGDTPHALEIARAVRDALHAAGIELSRPE